MKVETMSAVARSCAFVVVLLIGLAGCDGGALALPVAQVLLEVAAAAR